MSRTLDLDLEFARIVDELTRRGFLAGGLGTAAALGLAACGSSGPSGDSSSATGPWSYTDDLGRTVSLPKTPQRVATLADDAATTLWPAGLHVVATSMVAGTQDLLRSVGAGEADIASIVSFGAAGNKIDLEALTRAQPDLIVAPVTGGKLVTAAPVATLAKIAPVVGLALLGADLEDAMHSVHRLVGALGIDAADKDAERDYQQQTAALQTALQARPGLRVGFFWADKANLYLSVVEQWGYLKSLSALGMRFAPTTTGAADFWQTVSWENAAQLPVDLLVRWSQQEPESPAWKLLPAVKAGQVVDMSDKWRITSYAAYADNFAQLAAAVTAAAIVAPQ